MLEVTRDTNVYTARDEHVGSVDRIVLDPVTGRLTHVVVRKGIFFPEDKLIRFDELSTATPERINLRQDVEVDDLLPYVEQHYLPLDEADLPAGQVRIEPAFASTWYGPLGIASPMHQDVLLSVEERNIPDRLTALAAGVPVFTSDHQTVGQLERVVTTDAGLPTHFVIEPSGLSPDRRAVPVGWVEDISEDAIVLGATARMVDAIVPLGPDE